MKLLKILLLLLFFIPFLKQNIMADQIKTELIDKTELIAGQNIILNASELDKEITSVKWFVNNVEDKKHSNSVDNTYSFSLTDDMYNSWIQVEVVSGDSIYTDKVYFSKLPVIYIDTDNNKTIESKDEYLKMKMFIQGNELYDCQYNGFGEIKGRGNTTWAQPKKPYKIKLGSKADLFGFGSNKHWVLLANYLDQSLLRNKIAYDISKEFGLEHMESTWVDVILNNEYIGNYQLCEHIRIDTNRIDISNFEDIAEEIGKAIYKANKKDFESDTNNRDKMIDQMCEDFSWISTKTIQYGEHKYDVNDYYAGEIDIKGGYIFELSEEFDEVSKFTTNNGLKVMINSPEFAFTDSEMKNYVVNLWNKYEEAYSSIGGYNNDGFHYSDYANIDSMVSFFFNKYISGE